MHIHTIFSVQDRLERTPKIARKIVCEVHSEQWRRVAYYWRIVPVVAAAPAAAPTDRPPIALAAEALGTTAGGLGTAACCLGVRLEHCAHGGGDDLLDCGQIFLCPNGMVTRLPVLVGKMVRASHHARVRHHPRQRLELT